MSASLTRWLLLLTALALAVLRFFQPSAGLSWSETYQAAAHLFVGGLAVDAYRTGECRKWWLLAALTAVEMVAATLALINAR